MVNADKCRRLAAHLRALPPEAPAFNMASWFSVATADGFSTESPWADGLMRQHERAREDGCGTAACLAGHAVYLFGPGGAGQIKHPQTIQAVAAEHLFGRSRTIPDEAKHLFTPWAYARGPRHGITAVQAARVLEHLAETGEVLW